MRAFGRHIGTVEPAGLVAVLVALSSCSAGDSTRAVRAEPHEVDTQIAPSVNACPTFAFGFVLPKAIRRDETAVVLVQGTDLDSNDVDLSYAWSATSGEFSEPSEPTTDYRCAGTGPQLLSVVAADSEGCEAFLSLDVDCTDR